MLLYGSKVNLKGETNMKKVLSILCIAVMSLNLVMPTTAVSAKEHSIKTEMTNPNDNLMVTEDDKGITIIDRNLLNSKFSIEDLDDNEIVSKMASYKVKNIQNLGEYIDYSTVYQTLSGASGITLNLGLQKSISASVTSTFGVSKSDISSSVGFNVSKSYSVSYGGSYTVPSNVSRAVLKAHPLYEKYEYGIYLRGKMGLPDTRMETGYALKPIGIHYSKEFR